MLSEDIAFASCAQLANEVFERHGVEHRYTGRSLQHEFVGMGFGGVLKKLQDKYGFTVDNVVNTAKSLMEKK